MIKQYWQNLSDKDKRTLKIGGIILGVLFALRLIWWPLYNRINLLVEAIDSEQALIDWMRPRVASLLEAKTVPAQAKTLAGLQKSLQQAGLKPYVTEFSQNAQKQVSVTFESIPFESVMEWLEKAQESGWAVQQMSAQKGEKSGIVSLTLVLA